ncbi:TPA: hypothetical protein HA273_05775 [Candidatus Bathyarchaeota archaeon]|nr:hypothetical protein [Candidatus Bathyarchaeota archaeon]HIJ07877.1 hypothetical protein [Candidatus Bathyarchaeota archaeon]
MADLVENQKASASQSRNLICNFRAPNLEAFLRWKAYVQWAKDNGMDVCHLTLSLTDSFMKGIEGAAHVRNAEQVVNIQQNNVFQYQVSKPRREPYELSCVRSEFQKTISSVLFEAYVLNKARELTREFSYRDFLELKHDAFRRIVLRLKRKGKIVANPQRTMPRFYFLAERVSDYALDRRTIQ